MGSKDKRGFEPSYQASGEHPLRLSPSPRRDTIIPSGVNVDTVKWTSEVMYRQNFYPRAGMQTRDHAIISNYLTINAKLESYPNGDTVHNTYAIAALQEIWYAFSLVVKRPLS
jgi:hypothetical protein